MTCPGFEQLLDYLDGRLDRALTESVASHLALGCGHCDGDRSWYQEVKLVAASDDSIEPPPWVLKRALRLFDASRVRMDVRSRVGRVVALLVFDSRGTPALAGARSSGLEGRQLLYRAAAYSIDVQVAVSDQQSAGLVGQILREGEFRFESVGGLRIDLLREGERVLSTVSNDRGEFSIPVVDVGSYDLRIDVKEAGITIVGLPIAE